MSPIKHKPKSPSLLKQESSPQKEIKAQTPAKSDHKSSKPASPVKITK